MAKLGRKLSVVLAGLAVGTFFLSFGLGSDSTLLYGLIALALGGLAIAFERLSKRLDVSENS